MQINQRDWIPALDPHNRHTTGDRSVCWAVLLQQGAIIWAVRRSGSLGFLIWDGGDGRDDALVAIADGACFPAAEAADLDEAFRLA